MPAGGFRGGHNSTSRAAVGDIQSLCQSGVHQYGRPGVIAAYLGAGMPLEMRAGAEEGRWRGLNEEQRALLSSMGLPLSFEKMTDDVLMTIEDTLADEMQMHGLNEAGDGLNERGELCRSIIVAISDPFFLKRRPKTNTAQSGPCRAGRRPTPAGWRSCRMLYPRGRRRRLQWCRCRCPG